MTVCLLVDKCMRVLCLCVLGAGACVHSRIVVYMLLVLGLELWIARQQAGLKPEGWSIYVRIIFHVVILSWGRLLAAFLWSRKPSSCVYYLVF